MYIELPGVIHVIPNQFHSLQTTRSWDYLGLTTNSPNDLLNYTNLCDGIIIGLLDTGALSNLFSVNVFASLACLKI